MKLFTLPSYAKLNLALRVVGRRSDGFHELVTLFERIDLHDDISFARAKEGDFSIRCDDRRVPCDERNLIWKAARVLADGEKINEGARVVIKKRIPVAAGLAGGSSNAATALLGLNKLWSLKLSRAKLLAYARMIGSDVAFFLYDTPFALGMGRGEVIKPLDMKARLWHFLVVPQAPLLTKDVYGHFAQCFTKPAGDVNIMLRSLGKNDPVGVGAGLFNDLEAPILVLKPHLGKLKARVARQDVLGVSFSGSGPSVFAVVASGKEANKLKKIFSKTYKQVFVVRTKLSS
jgi:4-diphosphocytidyl-2-C-methyl-D-erythritol kinase